jgi:peroxin-1
MIDFEQAQAAFTPISLRGVTLQKSSVKWSDIGGKLLEPPFVEAET